MLELRNSKTTPLPDKNGRKSHAIDGFIGAVQMLDPVLGLVDIKPRLVRDLDGWNIEGAPYYAEVKDSGDRLFCPDKYDRSKYVRLPVVPLLSGLTKTLESVPTKLDGQLLASQIVMPTAYGAIRHSFTNTGMYLPIILNSVPVVASKTIDRLTFDVDSNLDILKLIASKEGLGILPGKLIDAEGKEQQLEWSYKNGQLVLGFNLVNPKWPMHLEDAIDVQVGASGNDGYTQSPSSFNNTGALSYAGKWTTGATLQSFHNFTGITIAQSSTIDVAYLSRYIPNFNGDGGTSPLTKVYADDQNDPAAPTTYDDCIGRTRTTAGVDWDEKITGDNAWHNSPSIISVIQELVTSYDYSNEAIQILHDDDGSATSDRLQYASYNWTGNTYGLKLHIEFTEGGGTLYTYASLVKLGIKPSPTRKLSLKRIGLPKIGIKITPTRRLAQAKSSLLKLGVKAIPTRKLSLRKSAPLKLGVKVNATRRIAEIRNSLVKLGAKATPTRKLALSKSSPVKMGIKPIPTRILSLGRSSLVRIGVKVAPRRILALTRNALNKIGIKNNSARTLGLTRDSLVRIGIKPDASRSVSLIRSSLAKIGIKVSASVSVLHPFGVAVINLILKLLGRSAILKTEARSTTLKAPDRTASVKTGTYSRSDILVNGTFENLITWNAFRSTISTQAKAGRQAIKIVSGPTGSGVLANAFTDAIPSWESYKGKTLKLAGYFYAPNLIENPGQNKDQLFRINWETGYAQSALVPKTSSWIYMTLGALIPSDAITINILLYSNISALVDSANILYASELKLFIDDVPKHIPLTLKTKGRSVNLKLE